MAVRAIAVGVVAVLAAAAVAAEATVASLNERVTAAFTRGEGGKLRLLSAPFRIRPGVDVAAAGLSNRLLRLDYRAEADALPAAGTFRSSPDFLEIWIRGFADGELEQFPGRFHIDLEGNVLRAIRRASGEEKEEEVPEIWLEPEPLGLYGADGVPVIKPVRLYALPPHVVQAVLAAEDVRFTSHSGIDPIGILRAAWANFQAGDI